MHDRLREELQSLGLDACEAPDEQQWRRLLEHLDRRFEGLAALEHELSGWRSVWATLPWLCVQTDLEGMIVTLNRTADGSPIETYLGVDILTLFPDGYREAVRASMRYVATERASTSYRVRAPKPPHGTVAWWETDLCPVVEHDDVVGLAFVTRDITHRVEAEEARRRSEEKTRALVDALPDLMFLLSADGRYVEWKPAKNVDPFGPPEDYLGKRVEEVLPEALAAQWQRLIGDVRAGEVITFEYAFGDQDYEARLTACGDGALATVRDVTERKRSEAELRQSETLYANLFRHSTDGILLHDRDGRIIDANQRAEVLFGYPKRELLGRSLHELHPADPPDEPLYEARRMNPDGVVEFETRFRRKDGEVFLAEVSANAFDLGDEHIVQSILRDVTERRRFEESLKHAKEEAERASRAKSQFLSNMSHELRTPLNAILGFGRVLDRGAYGPLNERQRQYLQDIIHSGEHMLELVNNLLDLRRLEERRDFIRPVPTAVGPVVEEAANMVKSLVEERSQRFTRDLGSDLPLAFADAHALVRVLVNLLSNAVKYTPVGGAIVLRVLPHDGLLLFEVHDSGVGIAPEHQTRIFNYFEQIRGTERLSSSGSGIGLALSRELVECMNGAIGVRSEPGRGSVFYFTLPALGPDDARPPRGQLNPGSPERP
jgi:PAS domain S-box-containing protein